MSPRDTARMLREAAVAGWSRYLRRVLCDEDVSQRELATSVGRAATAIARWVDRDEKQLPNLGDVERMPTSVATPVITRLAAAHGLTVVRVEPAAAPECHLAVAAEATTAGASATTATLSAHADGHYSRSELVEMESAYDRAARVNAAAREKARQAIAAIDGAAQ